MGVNGGAFGTIDLNTGVFTFLGNSSQTLAGMAVENGQLYGLSYSNSSGDLFTINPANGNLTSVGPSAESYIDFGSTTSGLYAVGFDGNLYSINANTGTPTLIGPTGVSNGTWSSLSTNSSTLYFSGGANFYTLNTTTGAATLVGNMGGPEVGALLLEGGVLYGGENSPVLAVDTLNPVTGVATTGSNLTGASSGSFFALAPNPVPVPEPSTWSLIGVGGVALLGMMLRKKHRIAKASAAFSLSR
jgi:PEP-CTERM motif